MACSAPPPLDGAASAIARSPRTVQSPGHHRQARATGSSRLRSGRLALTAKRVSPASRRLLHSDARPHPGEPVIAFPGGMIRVCALPDRVSAGRIAVIGADIERARTTTERWHPVMTVYSHGARCCRPSARTGIPAVMGALSHRSPCSLSSRLRALSWPGSFPLRVVHVSENRSKHRRSSRGRMSYIAHSEPEEITAEKLRMTSHSRSVSTGASCGSPGPACRAREPRRKPAAASRARTHASLASGWFSVRTPSCWLPGATRNAADCDSPDPVVFHAAEHPPRATTIADRLRAAPHSSDRAQSTARPRRIVRVRRFA